MKVLYGINTNGQGHINRSNMIIKELQHRGIEVECIYSGPPPPKYINNFGVEYSCYEGYQLFYDKHSLNPLKTSIKNIKNLLEIPRTVRKLKNKVKNTVDLLITDFDVYTSLIGRSSKIPTISIDHQHSIIDPNAIIPSGYRIPKWLMNSSIKFASPFKHYYYAIDYVAKPMKNKHGELYPLIWKKEFDNYEIYNGDHITVYLTHIAKELVHKVLSAFPDETFKVYGFNTSEKIDNIEFQNTSRDGFLQDLVRSKAVITNAGFSTTWEVLLLNKKILAIPHKKQFEQIANSYRIKNQQGCVSSQELSVEAVQQLLALEFNNETKYQYQTIERFVDDLLATYERLDN